MKKSIGINSMVFPSPVFVVGTYDEDEKPDMITIAWAGIAASDPAAVVIAVRPTRYSHENIIKHKAFTVNLPTKKFIKEADYFGITSGRDTDKLADTGLTAVKGEFVDAPYIEEFPFAIECELADQLDFGSHTLFIGAIKDIKVDTEIIGENDKVDFVKAGILTFDISTDSYLLPGEFAGKAFSEGLFFRKKE